MIRYKTRPGVVLTSICGEYILVSARKNRPECPYLTQINETSAFLWNLLVRGATPAQLEEAVAAEYEITDYNQLRESIAAFLNQLLELNYLLSEE